MYLTRIRFGNSRDFESNRVLRRSTTIPIRNKSIGKMKSTSQSHFGSFIKNQNRILGVRVIHIKNSLSLLKNINNSANI